MEEECNAKVLAADKYDYLKDLKEGFFVDMHDGSKWRAATVEKIMEKHVSAHYEGWSPKYDEKQFPKASSKMSAFRRNSIGYTGQLKQAYRDFKYSHDEKLHYESLLSGLLEKDFEWTSSPLEFTQQIRGHLIFFVDSLVTLQFYYKPSVDELNEIFEFLELVIKFILEWCKIIPRMKWEYWTSISHPMLYNIDAKAAVLSCYNEFSQVLMVMFGGNKIRSQRSSEFAYELLFEKEEKNLDKAYQWYSNKFFSIFQKLNGIEILNEMICAWDEKENGFLYPIYISCLFLEVLKPLLVFNKDEEFKKATVRICESLNKRFSEYHSKDFEDLDRFTIPRVDNLVEELFNKAGLSSRTLRENIVSYSYLYYLQDTRIESKRKGIDMLIEKYQVNLLLKECSFEIKAPLALRVEKALSAIKELKLMERVLMENSESSLVEILTGFIRLMVLQGSFEESHAQLLWNSSQNNPSINVAVFNIIAEIADYGPVDLIGYFFKLVKAIPISKYTKHTIKFITSFLGNLKKNIKRSKSQSVKLRKDNLSQDIQTETPSPLADFLDYDMLYQILSEKNIEKNLIFEAMEGLIKVIQDDLNQIYLFVVKAISDLEQGKAEAIINILFFRKVFLASWNSNNSQKILIDLIKSHNIFNVVFNLMLKYKAIVDTKLQQEDSDIVDPMNYEFVSGYKHEEYLKTIFDYFEFLFERTQFEVSLQSDNLEKLWTNFINYSLIKEERTFLFNILMKSRFDARINKKIYAFIPDDLSAELFKKYFLDSLMFNVESADDTAFECFKEYFIRQNTMAKLLKIEKGSVVTLSISLEGITPFWKFAFNNPSENIQEKATQFIITLFISLYKEKKANLNMITTSIADISLSQSDTVPRNIRKIKVMLNLLTLFLNQVEDINYTRINKDLYKEPPYTVRHCIVRNHEGKILRDLFIKIQDNMCINDLRNALSFNLKKSRNCFKLIKNTATKEVIDQKYDYVLMKNANIEFLVDLMPPQFPFDKSPSFFIANLPKTHEILLKHMDASEAIAKQIWQMFKFFPLNRKISEKISTLNFELEDGIKSWHNYLEVSDSPYELMYIFYVFKYKVNQNKGSVGFAQDYSKLLIKKKASLFLAHHLNFIYTTQFSTPNFCALKSVHYIHQCLLFILQQHGIDIISDIDIKKILELLCNLINNYMNEANTDNLNHDLKRYYMKSLKSALILVHQLGSTLGDIAIQVMEIDSTFQKSLNKYFKCLLKPREIKKINGSLWKYFQRTDKSAEYSQYLVRVLFYNVICDKTLLHSLQPHYFALIRKIIEINLIDTLNISLLNEKQILNELATYIINFEEHQGLNLGGIMSIIDMICKKFRPSTEFSKDIALINSVLELVFPCTEELSERQRRMQKEIIQDTTIVRSAIQLLKTLCMNNQEATCKIALWFSPLLVASESWRGPLPSDWRILAQESGAGASNKYVGLHNPANICYFNSLLQQLVMLRDFSESLLQIPCDPKMKLLYQSKIVFGTLHEQSHGIYNASHLCPLIQDFDGRALSLNEQKDVDEFFNLFLDRLGSHIRDTPNPELIEQIFGGCFANEIICIDCPHRSENIEHFLSLNIQIKGKVSLEESLHAFISSEKLDSANKYYCERCEKKMNAKRQTTFKILPNVLAIFLKRFDFDISSGQKKKINDYFEFPFEIDFEEYTEEYQLKKDLLENNKDKEENADFLNMNIPEEYYQYELQGIILHSGTAESGHYTSFIRDKEQQKWFEFNDEIVVEIDPERIPNEAYGGQEQVVGIGGVDSQHEMFAKIKNAYMLVYKRKVQYGMSELNALHREFKIEKNIEKFIGTLNDHRFVGETPKKKLSRDLESKILEYTALNISRSTLMNMDFIQLVTNLAISYNPSEAMDYSLFKHVDIQNLKGIEKFKEYSNTLEAWKFFTCFCLDILLRVKFDSNSNIFQMLRVLKQGLKKDLGFSMWMLSTLSHPRIINEFFLCCPTQLPRIFVSGLAVTASNILYDVYERKKLKKITKSLSHMNEYLLSRGSVCSVSSDFSTIDYSPKPEKSSTATKLIILDPNKHNVSYTHVMIQNMLRILPLLLRRLDAFCDATFCIALLARIGPEIRRYLLHSGMLAFSFELIFSNPGVATVSIKDLPPILIKSECFTLGFQPYFSENPSNTKLVKDLNKRPEKYKFLLDTFAVMFEETSLYTSDLTIEEESRPYCLSPDEQNFLNFFFEEKMVIELFEYSNNFIAREAISKICAHVAYDNLALSERLIQLLCFRLARSDFFLYPSFIQSLQKILLIRDSNELSKWKAFFPFFRELMTKVVHESYITYNYLTDMYIYLALNSPTFVNIIHNELDKFVNIRKWIDYNSYPAKGYVCFLKTMNKKVDVIKSIDSVDKTFFKEYSSRRVKLMKTIESGKLAEVAKIKFTTEPYPNILNYNLSEEITKGQGLDLKIKGEWLRARVLESADQVLHFCYQPVKDKMVDEWVLIGEDNVAPLGMFTQSEASSFYIRLRKYLGLQLAL